MKDHPRGWPFWIALTLLVAAGVHAAAIWAVPRLVMARAIARMGPPDTMRFPRLADDTSRAVVRPSPDILYSSCPFDLSKGPLRVVARVPHDTYWSIAAYDSATDNFFVRNDQQIAGDRFELILIRRGQPLPLDHAATEQAVAFAPDTRGIVLLRMVIDDMRQLGEPDALRRQAHCETVASQSGLR
jgi:uncharacterized membrane protein